MKEGGPSCLPTAVTKSLFIHGSGREVCWPGERHWVKTDLDICFHRIAGARVNATHHGLGIFSEPCPNPPKSLKRNSKP